ncbi:unnamed protein product [Citrullus colocynthis]|uniref:Uncharacterized protein n=1 Tax=Citrullus colocynthis TaxID=252529 RepID=A0ABP0YBB7_9ROSI
MIQIVLMLQLTIMMRNSLITLKPVSCNTDIVIEDGGDTGSNFVRDDMVNRMVPFSMQNTNIVNRLQLKDRLQPNVVSAPENIDELRQLKVAKPVSDNVGGPYRVARDNNNEGDLKVETVRSPQSQVPGQEDIISSELQVFNVMEHNDIPHGSGSNKEKLDEMTIKSQDVSMMEQDDTPHACGSGKDKMDGLTKIYEVSRVAVKGMEEQWEANRLAMKEEPMELEDPPVPVVSRVEHKSIK